LVGANPLAFQLPLSGSLGARGGVDIPRDDIRAFNSLSRDHTATGTVVTLNTDFPTFQLPLSGSRDSLVRLKLIQKAVTFNSLSRDHTLLEVGPVLRGLFLLSTPSLGITIRTAGRLGDQPATDSFNSLSRDHELLLLVLPMRFGGGSFNSLSRDHRALFRDFPALRGFPPRHPFAHLYFSATI